MRKIIEQIAKKHLNLEDLVDKHSGEDFQEQATWGIRRALTDAYIAGKHGHFTGDSILDEFWKNDVDNTYDL